MKRDAPSGVVYRTAWTLDNMRYRNSTRRYISICQCRPQWKQNVSVAFHNKRKSLQCRSKATWKKSNSLPPANNNLLCDAVSFDAVGEELLSQPFAKHRSTVTYEEEFEIVEEVVTIQSIVLYG